MVEKELLIRLTERRQEPQIAVRESDKSDPRRIVRDADGRTVQNLDDIKVIYVAK